MGIDLKRHKAVRWLDSMLFITNIKNAQTNGKWQKDIAVFANSNKPCSKCIHLISLLLLRPILTILSHHTSGLSAPWQSQDFAYNVHFFYNPPLSLTQPALMYGSSLEQMRATVNNIKPIFSAVWRKLIGIHVPSLQLQAPSVKAGETKQNAAKTKGNKLTWFCKATASISFIKQL